VNKFLRLGVILLFFGFSVSAEPLNRRLEDLESFVQALEAIESHGLYETEHSELINQAISGMLRSLDPYSRLLDTQDLERLKKSSSGQVYGLGLSIEPKENQLWVTRVAAGSPADKAGIKRGDQILRVMGKSVLEFDLQSIQDEPGPIEIQWSPGNKAVLSKTWFSNPGLKFTSVSPEVLVIQLEEFFTETPALIKAKLLEVQPQKILIDLRDNPGGLVFSAVEVAELFVPPGLIIETRDRHQKVLETFVARTQPLRPKAKIAVLINHNSASAAEILAQSLTENKVATAFGETSYGKGVVQSLFPLLHGRYALLTMAQYYGPSGKSFHQVGITPKVKVTDHWKAPRYSPEDQIYTQALRWLTKGP